MARRLPSTLDAVPLPTLPRGVLIREVGPRDGLQSEAPASVEMRVRLIDALIAAGLARIEMCSFVSPTAVPAMAGAAEVLVGVGDRPGVRRTALVPNVRGAQLALSAASTVDELTVTISASAIYSEKNTRMSIDDALNSVGAIVAEVAGRVPVDAVLSCSFGSPYEGDIAPATVAGMVARLFDSGVDCVTLADTTGMATPRRIDEVISALPVAAMSDLGLHLHETRGTALTNAYAAMMLGVRRFDTSIGGLGGSPFAVGAAGNLATEDLVFLCDDLGVGTGIELTRLLQASVLAAEIVGRTLPSRVASAGPRLTAARVSDAVV